MTQKEKLDKWIEDNPEEYSKLLEEHKKKTQVCFKCEKSLYPIMYKDWKYLKNFKTIDNKVLYVCKEHATQEIYEQYKDQFFVEFYHENKIYFYNNLYLPYFTANYGYETIEQCQERIDHPELIVIPNNYLFYNEIFYQNISENGEN